MEEIKDLYIKASVIYEGSITYKMSWRVTYNEIFSKEISRKVFNLIDLDYVDPDMDYEDDVRAFMNAFDSYMEEACSTKEFCFLQKKIVDCCIDQYD